MSNQPDSELSATARQVIADARDFGEPTAEDRERVRTRWLATIAVGAGLTSLSGAARAATASSWGLKSAGLALAVVAGVGGLYVMYGRTELPGATKEGAALVAEREPVERAAVHIAPDERAGSAAPQSATTPYPTLPSVPSEMPGSGGAAPAPAISTAPLAAGGQIAPVVTAPLPNTSGADASGTAAAAALVGSSAEQARHAAGTPEAARVAAVPVHEARRVVGPAVQSGAVAVNSSAPARREVAAEAVAPASSKAGPSSPSSRLGEEIALLSRIRSSVQAGANAQALVLLDEYGRTFEHPALGMEARALRVDALCRSGQRAAARLQASAFEGSWPESPLLERVRTACP